MADIPVNESTAETFVTITSNGQTSISFDFLIFRPEQLHVGYKPVGAGAWVPLVYPADFTISGVSNPAGGTVMLQTVATSIGDKFMMRRETPIERAKDWQNAGDYKADLVNAEQDEIYMIMQELDRDVSLSIRVNPGEVPPTADEFYVDWAAAEQAARDAEAARDVAAGYASDAVSQGNVPIYATAVGLAALDLPDGINVIRTNGYYAAEGKGSALYRLKDALEPAEAGDISSNSNTKRWGLADQRLHAAMFGIKGFSEAETPVETAAFFAALEYATQRGKPLHVDDMNIGISWGDLPSGFRLKGTGAADITTWFNNKGDKLKLRPGFKHLVSGSNIWLMGGGAGVRETLRSDKFSEFTYGLGYQFDNSSFEWDGVGLIQNMDVYDADGNLTSGATDNRATGYDVAFDNASPMSEINNSNIFGYWDKGASYLIRSRDDINTVDSDYNRAFRTNFTGVALIAGDAASDVNGLTGSDWYGCGFYSSGDHHDAPSGNYASGACPSIFIDGNNGIDGSRAHSFIGNLRCRSNDAIMLDRCDQVRFSFGVEVPTVAGIPGADAPGRIRGTVRTNEIFWDAMRAGRTSAMGILELGTEITGPINLYGGGRDRMGFQHIREGGNTTRMFTRIGGDSVIQMSSIPDQGNSGWTIFRDDDQNDDLTFRFDNLTAVTMLGGLRMLRSNNGYQIGNTGPTITAGNVNPEGNITASVGSLHLLTNSANPLRLKASGTGNTGWVTATSS